MKNVYVKLTLDVSRLEAALRHLNESLRETGYQFRRVGRQGWRTRLTPGERHIDRICREITSGKPGRPAHIRLLVAADFAAVLDGAA